MRPGVPWNVKGIEADAREAAQLAARRAGVSLGEYLTQLIMTEGRVSGPQQAYQQSYPQAYLPGDGTYGPQPVPVYQPPVPSMRYPHAVPQPQPQGYAQGYPQHYAQPMQRPTAVPPQPQPHEMQQRDPLGGAAQALDAQIRGSEFAVVAHGLRDLADRLENSERRAQTAIATVNQSVAAMQDRIDAAERVKQLADVAFSSAADALAQSARDQSFAFDSLETTVRSVQKRLSDFEAGRAELPNKDTLTRLETAIGQLQKRLGEMEALKTDTAHKDTLARLESTLGQLQKRLGEMEQSKAEFPAKDALARLETWINDVRHDVADSEKRSREDISQLAKFMRELGTRVDANERGVAQVHGNAKAVTEGVSARLDALEARSASMFDEMRGQLSSIDGRLAQSAQGKGGVQPEQFQALKRSVDVLNERVEKTAASTQTGVQPEAFAALKRSVDTLSSTFDGLTERLDMVSDPQTGPFANSLGAIGSTLEALTSKIEDGERRAADSVSTMSSALKAISTRLDETEKRHTHALQKINARFDDSDRQTIESSRTVEDTLKSLAQRLDSSDKRHKEAIGGLRLTVDGLVAKAAADAVPLDQPRQSHFSSQPPSFTVPVPPSALDTPPELPPISTTTARALSMPPTPPPFDDLPPKPEDGYSVSALQTIMARTMPPPPPSTDVPNIDPDSFDREFARELDRPDDEDTQPGELTAQPGDLDFAPKREGYLEQARRAAKAAAAEAEQRQQQKRPIGALGREEGKSRNLGRIAILAIAGFAVIAGVIALLFTIPGGDNEINRPDPTSSLNEMLNPEPAPAGGRGSPAEFAPASGAEAGSPGAAVTVEPNGLGVEASQPGEAPTFTAGTSALPGGDPAIPALEASATRGDAKAQLLLAIRYSEGSGVAKDDVKAASLVTKAAQQGFVIAQYRLGAIYERGVGAPKDLAQAKQWYERAAKGGNRKAMHNLAVLHADPDAGTQNFPEAARWFRAGAEYGLADSQYNLGILLERGMGVERNVNEAAKWYAVAASQGDTGAAERLDALKRTMPPADVAIATEAARTFQPKPLDPAANDTPR